jgi:hypothetical protein
VQVAEQIWVTIAEAAEITGYSAGYISALATKMWKLSENERVINVRKRSGRQELWLPDLAAYAENRGPYKKTEIGA